MKIVEFLRKTQVFSGPGWSLSVPKAIPEDTRTRRERLQRTKWIPGRSPGSARRQFGDVSGAHWELSKHSLKVFLDHKSNYLEFPIEEEARSVFQLEGTHEALRFRPNLRRRPLTTQWIARIPFAVA